MKVLLLLAFSVVGALAASLEHEDGLIQIKLEQKHVSIDALKVSIHFRVNITDI
jgi:hypothetical protein